MSRRLRDELHDVFETLSEPAHPSLAGRVREAIEHGPPRASRTPRLAVAVAVLATLTVVAGLLLAGHRGAIPPGTPAGQATAVPRATPAPATATPAPVPTRRPSPAATAPAPAPPGSGPAAALPAFSCAVQSGGGGGTAGLTAVRASPQGGFDRFVIQFDGPVPRYQVTPQASATFTSDPQGSPVTLAGTAGLRVTVTGVSNWASLSGPTDLKPGGPALEEARQVGDFEGVVTWGLGLAHVTCFRAYTLRGPDRLVIDVQA
jgi:hypothetical protein